MISAKLLFKAFIVPLLFSTGLGGCENNVSQEEEIVWQRLEVTASAYNSTRDQGQGNPEITAWGDTLRPGQKSIAVSRDLIQKGLTYKTPVKIQGLEGIYIVNDKMHPRWRNKIDIYMGEDRQKALQWGRRKIFIEFPNKTETEPKLPTK